MNDSAITRALAEQVAVFFWQCQGGELDEPLPEPNEGDWALAHALMPMVRHAVAEEMTSVAEAIRTVERHGSNGAPLPSPNGLVDALHHRAHRLRRQH